MDRRTLLKAASVAPVVALAPLAPEPAIAAEQTEIQCRYRDWLALTKDYFAVDAKCALGEIDGTGFEQLADPILDRRDEIEELLFSLESQTLEDFAVKTKISAYFQWNVTYMQEGLLADVERVLASRKGAV
jgi:hypothetical protein